VAALTAPCVVRSTIDWDTREPRDLRLNELAYLYCVEVSEREDMFWLHLISLEHRGKRYTLMMRSGMKPERWLEVLT